MSTQGMNLSEMLEAAMGVDRSWMKGGKCWQWAASQESKDNPNPWHAANNETYGPDDDIKGSELVKYALIVCSGCQCQYDCARYAVQTDADYVTSAMRVGDLRWLKAQGNWELIVDIAEVVSVPIQDAIKTIRHPERSTDLPRTLA